MNRLRIAILATMAIGVTQAEYIVKYPLTHIPAGSIQLVTPQAPAGNWVVADPVYTEWVNEGSLYDCNWTPATSTVLTGASFTQTATSCKQDKVRTKQNREQESNTLAYRNVGDLIIETETGSESTSGSQQVVGTGTKTTNCKYNYNVSGVPENYWFNGTSTNNVYIVKSNGVQLKNEYGYTKTSMTLNGVSYSAGAIKAPYAGGNYRELCITSIQ
jgi:hypothetical protein